MAILSSLCPLTRVVYRAVRSLASCSRKGPSKLPAESSSSGLEKYRELQRHFTKRLRETYNRFSSIPHNSVVRGHHHVYFVEANSIYRVDTRRSGSEPEEVLYLGQCCKEEEEEEEEEEEWIVQRVRLSPREKHLAATLKTPHREEPRCVVVRLGEAAPLDPPQTILTLDKVFSFEWATDEVMFYTSQEGLRCSRVFRLNLISTGTHGTLVYEDTQPDVFVEMALSRDQRLLTINCSSKTSSEVWLIDVATPLSEPLLVQPRLPELLYHVEHWKGWLLILANTGPGQEYQVLKAPLSCPSVASWVPLCTPGPGTALRDMEVVGDWCVLTTRVPTGHLALSLVPLGHPQDAYTVQNVHEDAQARHEHRGDVEQKKSALELPSWACVCESCRPGLAEDHRGVLEFHLSSPVHLPVLHRLYPRDGLLLSGTEDDGAPPENQAQGDYITTRLEAPSQDGTLVPVTVLHAVPVESLRGAPLLVHVYGAYGRELNMSFSPERRLLLEQGWALAYCHIRGGGERGLAWHKQARLQGKPKGVEDLLACLRHLHALGVSSPRTTALSACSAGAVPVGALCNAHPHLARAVTLQAPFLDVLGSMEDPCLALTAQEREEWGDPLADPRHRHAIATYCPSHNITPQHYPSMLLTAYSGDARVPLAGVLKYTKRLKEAIHTHLNTHPASECEPVPSVVLNVQPGADHFGPADFELALAESALQLAFLYAELGLEPPRSPRKRRRKQMRFKTQII